MRNVISNVQDFLSFKHCNGPSFSSNVGLGRVAVLAALLSVIFGIHITLMVSLLLRSSHDSKNENLSSILVIQWCLNVCFIVVFHLSEFFVTAIYNPSVVSAESFMVDHSKAYTVAMVTSWVEFWIEYAFVKFLEIDQIIVMPVYMRWIGLVFVMTGQVLRTAAMATCGPSFNHLIQKEKKPNHVLITHGVYSVFRHPSYVGWFFWSIGTQLMLLNPLTTIAYTWASLNFFRKRIPYEEATLIKHFGDDYRQYVAKTFMGIPFIPRANKSKET